MVTIVKLFIGIANKKNFDFIDNTIHIIKFKSLFCSQWEFENNVINKNQRLKGTTLVLCVIC